MKKRRAISRADGATSTRATNGDTRRGSWPRRWTALAAGLLVLLAAAFYWRLSSSPGHMRRETGQNVLLITIDTLRADALGAAGGRAATPNLDALAADGVRFDDAHAHAVTTLPSHTSILTGLYPYQHGVHDNTGYRLRTDVPTLATMLKAAGYATGAFVGSFSLDSRFGLTRGFDVYDDHYGEVSRAIAFGIPERPAGTVVSLAAAWIRQQRGKWFAWVHVFDPHAPYRPPSPFDAQYASDPYDGEVAYVDSALGPLLALARQQKRPTFIVVTGDHGESLGSHGELTHGLFAYEATLKIPLIVDDTAQPRAFRRNVSDISARHVDIVPTILDEIGMRTPGSLPGRSLLTAIERRDNSRPASYFEALSAFLNRGWAPLTGVLVGRDKYIDLPIPELYSLRSDPGESANRLPAEADRGRTLEARLHEFAQSPASTEGRVRENSTVVAQLQALGYVSGSAPAKSHYTEDDDPKRLVALDTEIMKGVQLFQTGRLNEALDVYRDVIAKRPTMPVGYLHAAFLQWEMGQAREAVATLETALKNGAATGELQAQLGVYLAESGSPEKAIGLLAPVATSGTTDVDALNAYGIAQARAGHQGDALATFRRALELGPDNATALQNMGTIYVEQKNDTAARQAFTAALALDPNLATALNGLGVVELRSGNRGAAVDAWKRAVAADPHQYDTLFNLGMTLRDAGDTSQAREYFERFVRTAPPAFYASDIARVSEWLKKAKG